MNEIPTAATSSRQGEILPTAQRPRLGPAHFRLGRALTILLASCVGVGALSALLDVYFIGLLSRWQADPARIVVADAELFDTMSLVLLVLTLLVVGTTGIATVTWLYQAYGSREADPALLPHKRWWTIGGWLIPFINLVRPFQLMRNLYRATTSPPSSEQHDPHVAYPACFAWWWACLLLASILTNMADRLMTGDPDLGQLRTAVSLDLISQVILIAAAVLFIRVLRSITTNLWRRANG
jgi:heme/copper-type cytochrome/quinol oxidase subunit 2